MWIGAEYEPITAFGLRPSNTTSSGGKSLLVPTPYAVKMALLDRLIRFDGESAGREAFPAIRDVTIFARAPQYVAVNRTFQKVLRPEGKLWTSTIAQREYCFFAGWLALHLYTASEMLADRLPHLLSAINYFGRRGGFMQLVSLNQNAEGPRGDFVDLCTPVDLGAPQFGLLQRMDDMRKDARFEEVSVLIPQKPSSDGGRRQYNVALPYQLEAHGFNHTVYRWSTS